MSSTITGLTPTVLGPLTTTFTPPPACTIAVGSKPLFQDLEPFAHLGKKCTLFKPADEPSCWPPMASGASIGQGYYSPGLNCPSGYATACSATGGKGGKSDWPLQFQLRAQETAVGCCPSGYACANIDGQTCISIATSTTIEVVTCGRNRAPTQVVLDDKASITAFSLFAPMIQINWQESDLPQTTSDAPMTTSGIQTVDTGAASGIGTLETAGPEPTGSLTGIVLYPSDMVTGAVTDAAGAESAAATPSTPASASASEPEGLPVSTKVGLGVVGGVLAIAVIFSAFFFVWRRRQKQRQEEEAERLYELKHGFSSSSSNLNQRDDMPGWYPGRPVGAVGGGGGGFGQGQMRQMTPTPSQFQGSAGLPPPNSPYYRPYRP